MLRISGLAFGLALAASGIAVGQEVIAQPPDASATPIRRASQLLGSAVRLQDGVNFGRIEDIVFDEGGTIQYLVVSHEDRYVMVPYPAARLDLGQRVVILDVTPQVLQPLLFTRGAWPNVADPAFGQRIQRAFGPRALRREIRRQERDLRPIEPRATQPRRGDRTTEEGLSPEGRRRPDIEARPKAPDLEAEQPPARPRAEEPTRPLPDRDQPRPTPTQPPPVPVEPQPQPTPNPVQP
jgi:sporulation protein YlmC with PRC-barrel domain